MDVAESLKIETYKQTNILLSDNYISRLFYSASDDIDNIFEIINND